MRGDSQLEKPERKVWWTSGGRWESSSKHKGTLCFIFGYLCPVQLGYFTYPNRTHPMSPAVPSWSANCYIYCKIIFLDLIKRFYQVLSQYLNISLALWNCSHIPCEIQVFVKCHSDSSGLKPQNILPIIIVVNFSGFKNLLLCHSEILGCSVIFLYQWIPELIELYQEDKMGVPLWNLLYSVQYKLWQVSSLVF